MYMMTQRAAQFYTLSESTPLSTRVLVCTALTCLCHVFAVLLSASMTAAHSALTQRQSRRPAALAQPSEAAVSCHPPYLTQSHDAC